MEILKEQIESFLCNVQGGYSYGYGKGNGYGNGYSYGDGNGNGYGYGDGNGDGDGYGDGNGYGNGYGYGDGDGNGNGYGDGNGYGYGNGYGNGYGDGCGDGYGNGYGYDDGNGNGYGSGEGCGNGNGYGGITEINGYKVHNIDDIRTIITSIHGNIAQGYIVEKNTKLVPCYIAKENNKFAHGSTLKEAFSSLQEKLYDDSTEEERLEAFKKKFPCYDEKYDNKDLFTYHHILTGSCKMGRESFVRDEGLSLEGKTTVREFVALTKDAYGGIIIEKLPKAYGIID